VQILVEDSVFLHGHGCSIGSVGKGCVENVRRRPILRLSAPFPIGGRTDFDRLRMRADPDFGHLNPCGGLQVLYRNISMTAQECGNRVKTYSSTEGGGHVR